MSDSGGHFTNLMVFAFDEFESDPAIRDCFADADGRGAGGEIWLGGDQPAPAGKGALASDNEAAFEPRKGVRSGDVFDLRPVFAFVAASGVEESGVEGGLVAEEEEAFGIGVETADGVDVFWEAECG